MISKYRFLFLALAAALCYSISPSTLLAKELLAQTQATDPGKSGFRKHGSLRKADTAVTNIIEEFRAHAAAHAKAPGKQSAAASFKSANRFVLFQQGMMLVEATASENGQQLMDDLVRLGMQDAAVYGSHVAGWLPVELVETATELTSLQSLSATSRPIHNDYPLHPGDAPTSPQGDKALRADFARSVHSVDGEGITIGVISDSYDKSDIVWPTDAAADIASGDLPPAHHPISATEYPLCGAGYGCTDEGRAMMQIVHDLAPGATLMFHTGLPNPVAYANNIQYLADPAGGNADIIVDDLSYLNEPMFQDGIIAQAVDSAVANGVGYYSAAGNQGRESYESAFEESVEVLCIGTCDPITGLVGPAHDFDTTPPDPGAVCNPAPGDFAAAECNIDTLLNVTIPAYSSITVVLQWDEPFGNVNTGDGPQSDLIITLLDSGPPATLLEISGSDNVVNGNPVEILQFVNDGTNPNVCPFYPFITCPPVEISGTIVVAYDAVDSVGPPPSLMKMVFHVGPGVVLDDLIAGYATDSPTVVGHQNATGAVAVGAAFYAYTPEFGVTPPELESYSAAGGVPILFDTSGTALPVPVIRGKPEIVAVDGVSTTFFSSQKVGDSLPDFFGTSAAVPHAAAVAALVMEANPSIPPWKIANALKMTAIDMTATAGFDFDSGYGLIQADAAVAAALAVVTDPSALIATAVFASQVDLSWTDNSGNETGFDIERSPTGAGTWVLAGSTDANVNVYSDTGLASNTPYDYRVKATYNAGTDSGYSNTVSATTLDSCPAGPHDVSSGVWHMIALPCDPSPANKVTDIFPALDPAKYISHWIVYRYDAVNNVFDDVPVDGAMSEGVGYFAFVHESTSVSISGSPFTPEDIPLEADGFNMQFNLLGHNRNGYVSWADVEIIDVSGGNAVYTLEEADPDLGGSLGLACAQEPTPHESCLMSREMFKWNGATYIMADGDTLGVDGSLLPFDGFWVSAFRSGIKLRIPPPSLPPLPSAATATADATISKAASLAFTSSKNKKPTATPWFIRLIAESDGKQDPGNVLGQMETSTNGQDRHDLKEKYPFDTHYLSILFTNPEFEQTNWGFTSDFRKLGNKAKGRWDFVVKASPDVESVTLRWEGDKVLFDKAYLLDVQKDRRIKASPDGSYTFSVTGEETPFVFILK